MGCLVNRIFFVNFQRTLYMQDRIFVSGYILGYSWGLALPKQVHISMIFSQILHFFGEKWSIFTQNIFKFARF